MNFTIKGLTEGLSCITGSYANLENVLKPNLNEKNQKILSHYLSFGLSQISCFIEILKNPKAQLEIALDNNTKISQNFSHLLEFLNLRKFETLSNQALEGLEIIERRPLFVGTKTHRDKRPQKLSVGNKFSYHYQTYHNQSSEANKHWNFQKSTKNSSLKQKNACSFNKEKTVPNSAISYKERGVKTSQKKTKNLHSMDFAKRDLNTKMNSKFGNDNKSRNLFELKDNPGLQSQVFRKAPSNYNKSLVCKFHNIVQNFEKEQRESLKKPLKKTRCNSSKYIGNNHYKRKNHNLDEDSDDSLCKKNISAIELKNDS